MSDDFKETVTTDFEGKEFKVRKYSNGGEYWSPVDNPDWKFEVVDMKQYQGKDALDLGLRYSCNRAMESRKDREDLFKFMPVIDKMFLPSFKDRYIQKTEKMGNIICVCNASTFPSSKYQEKVFAARANTGLGALSRYWQEHTLYLNPGSTSFGEDKNLREITKEETLKCLNLIEERDKNPDLIRDDTLYYVKMTQIMELAIAENATDRVAKLAEKLLERNKYDVALPKAITSFLMETINEHPELAGSELARVAVRSKGESIKDRIDSNDDVSESKKRVARRPRRIAFDELAKEANVNDLR